MKSIAVFMHVPFEGLGCIEQWITKNNHTVSYTRFYEKYELPDINAIDWLIVMGGPMGVYDETIYPWLSEEKAFIKQAIDTGKTVLGICLGSQLIAEVLGAKVYPNKQKEIGWFDVALSEKAKTTSLFDGFEDKFPVFHWHGDTFDLPNGSTHLISSEVCNNQAFLYNDKVLGLQFHFEVTAETLRGMVENGTSELIEGETIQSADKILLTTEFIASNNLRMHQILDNLAK
ncbi:MAG: type 1 glutamine amidotransferase [Paludibacter sp.]|nr:type 1 glutamine amidotransferase [Paludibacter sp.]